MSALFPNRLFPKLPVTDNDETRAAYEKSTTKNARKVIRAMSPHERRAFLAMCGYRAAARQIVKDWSSKK